MFEIDIIYNGIHVIAKFNNKLNFLIYDSGTGKTLLMQAIILFCKKNKMKFKYFNYLDADIQESELINSCINSDIILLDNADLYLTDSILQKLIKDKKYIIVSMKYLHILDVIDYDEFIVKYDNKQLVIEEV